VVDCNRPRLQYSHVCDMHCCVKFGRFGQRCNNQAAPGKILCGFADHIDGIDTRVDRLLTIFIFFLFFLLIGLAGSSPEAKASNNIQYIVRKNSELAWTNEDLTKEDMPLAKWLLYFSILMFLIILYNTILVIRGNRDQDF
jgi:hypothetical protein